RAGRWGGGARRGEARGWQNIAVSVRRSAAAVFAIDTAADDESGFTAAAAGPVSLAPQSSQKLAADGLGAPHFGQSTGNGAPHAPQNLAPSRLACRHPGHSIGGPWRQFGHRTVRQSRHHLYWR